uniref:Calcium uniporter protein C-terminal domain-containing protein n=1 Tax=Hyaloperonospora arabidopsidis (strain Emoy2) TaxID=559515 RepID=M4BBR9_HYAAE
MASRPLRTLLLRASYAHFSASAFHSGPKSLLARAATRSHLDSMLPQLCVRNTAKVLGQLDILLPLPGLKGLTRLGFDHSQASVQDLIEAVRHADTSLRVVEVATLDGTKVARTVRLGALTSMAFCLRLNHVNVLVESDKATTDDARLNEEDAAFASVKAAMEKDRRLLLPLPEFYRLCHNAGAEKVVAAKWLQELQRRNLVVHFDRSRNPQLENALILRPYNSLDSEMYNIKHYRRAKEREVAALMTSLTQLKQIETDVHVAARRLPNAQKWVALTGLTGFYGTLMYCVWDVYSWDVMEPITYFIGFTAVLGNSFYSTITKKDPTYSNIWQKRYAERVHVLSKEREFEPAELEELQGRIVDLRNDIMLLSQWETTDADNQHLPIE